MFTFTQEDIRAELERFAALPRMQEQNATVVNYRVAMDNFEPFPRRVLYGCMVRYTHEGTRPDTRYWIPADNESAIPFHKLIDRLVIMDDGHTVTPHYCAAWREGPPPEGFEDSYLPHGIFIPFPLSEGTRPDNGRPVDMSGWMLGPRMAYHFKLEEGS